MENLNVINAPHHEDKFFSAMSDLVDSIISELRFIYPECNRYYKTKEDIAELKEVWVNCLAGAGLRGMEDIERGLHRCRQSKSDFMISPGVFIDYCREKPEDIKDSNGRPLLSATEAHRASFKLPEYFGPRISQSHDQDMITSFVISLCGGDASYRAMNAVDGKKAFISNYPVAIERWKEIRDINRTREDKLNMYYNPVVPRPEPIEAPAPRLLQTPQEVKEQGKVLTPYEEFKFNAELARNQSPKDFGQQFRHLTQEQHIAKIKEVLGFAGKGTLGASQKMPPIDPKYYPVYVEPEMTIWDKRNPELYHKWQSLRAKAHLDQAIEEVKPQPQEQEQEQPEEQKKDFSAYYQQPKADYQQPEAYYQQPSVRTTAQADSALPKTPSNYGEDSIPVDFPLSETASQDPWGVDLPKEEVSGQGIAIYNEWIAEDSNKCMKSLS